MSGPISVGNIVDYVVANRRKKAFEGWLPSEIAQHVIECAEDRSMVYAVGSDGEVVGVVTCQRFDKDKVLFVTNILTSARNLLPEFIKVFKALYPGYSLEADRRGKRVVYNTPKLVAKIDKQSTNQPTQ